MSGPGGGSGGCRAVSSKKPWMAVGLYLHLATQLAQIGAHTLDGMSLDARISILDRVDFRELAGRGCYSGIQLSVWLRAGGGAEIYFGSGARGFPCFSWRRGVLTGPGTPPAPWAHVDWASTAIEDSARTCSSVSRAHMQILPAGAGLRRRGATVGVRQCHDAG